MATLNFPVALFEVPTEKACCPEVVFINPKVTAAKPLEVLSLPAAIE